MMVYQKGKNGKIEWLVTQGQCTKRVQRGVGDAFPLDSLKYNTYFHYFNLTSSVKHLKNLLNYTANSSAYFFSFTWNYHGISSTIRSQYSIISLLQKSSTITLSHTLALSHSLFFHMSWSFVMCQPARHVSAMARVSRRLRWEMTSTHIGGCWHKISS